MKNFVPELKLKSLNLFISSIYYLTKGTVFLFYLITDQTSKAFH